MSIILQIKAGNEKPLVHLYEKHRDEFIIWAGKNYGCEMDDAKDIFQDSIIALYENIKSGQLTEQTSDIKTYLFAIGKFKTINFQKRKNKSVTFSDFNSLKVVTPKDTTIMDNEESEFIKETAKKYLDNQCEDCKKILQLYYFNELDMKTIAEEMGYKNADVAKKKKYECFKKLAAEVKSNLKMMIL